VSGRTLDRDLKNLRDDFGLEIKYKRPNGYYLDEDYEQDSSKIENLMHLTSSTFFKIKYANESVFIQPDTSVNAIGNEHLEDFYYAISKGFKVKLTYHPFGKEAHERVVSPQILREYRQRWYILVLKDDNQQRLYSLDRIKKLQVLTDIEALKIEDKDKVFKNVIGVSIPQVNPEKVILKFDRQQGNYIVTQPMHHSQQIVSDDENGVTINLNVVTNWELKETIRSHGHHVTILEPKHLIEEFIADYEIDINNYKNI
jgi:predicted DNA-binding transcriptional regulator YafY